MKPYRFVDLFCGGGGSISGAINALNAAGMKYEGRGFNHWKTAIETVRANHPEVIPDFNRACAPIQSLLPDEIFSVDPERIDSIWASPSCTHHSRAAGKKPKSRQLREQPEYLLPYLRLTKCRRMYIENVKELREWGPVLDSDTVYKGKRYFAGQPDPRKIGAFFNLWYREIKASGYNVEMAVLNAADYGAATSRERLIVQAVRKSSGCRIVWPEQTHMREPGLLAGTYQPWRSASEIIDWSIKGESIFDRAKPLCENTMRRIEAGIRKYWGAWAEPFLIVLRGTSEKQLDSTAIPLSSPLPTIAAQGGHIALIQPLIVPYKFSNGAKPDGEPLQTITTIGNHALIQPIWLDLAHTKNNGVSGTVGAPLNTITCSHGTHCVVEPFLMEYYTGGRPQTIGNPVPTITTKDRFGVVEGRCLQLPDGKLYKLDITHRMLTMRELANATGFSADYVFFGGDTAAKKQIGNAVPPDLARALYLAELSA